MSRLRVVAAHDAEIRVARWLLGRFGMKKTTTKLALRSESVRQLTGSEIRQVAGGLRAQTYDGCTYTQLATGCTIGTFGSCNASCVDCYSDDCGQ
jgi:hypothetical protein